MAAKKRRAQGAGTIRERALKDGTIVYDVVAKIDGKQRRLGVCATPQEAEAYVALNAIRRRESGRHVPYDLGVMTLRRLGHLFLDALPAHKLVTHKSRWHARVESAEFIDWALTQFSEQAVRKWISDMAETPVASGKSKGKLPARGTLQASLDLLRSAFKWAVIKGHVDRNPAKNVSISESTVTSPHTSEVGEVFDYLLEDEVKKLLTADLPAKQKTAFTLLAFTGARPKDLYLLTWDRVDVRGATIVYRTHKRKRNYPAHLLPIALEAIRAWWIAHGQPSSGLVFSGRNGAPHTKGYDWGWADTEPRPGYPLRGYRARAGIRRKVPLYSLRHTAASHLLLGTDLFTGGRTWSPPEVASFLGHADLSTVETYMVSLGIASKRAVEESRVALKSMKRRPTGSDE